MEKYSEDKASSLKSLLKYYKAFHGAISNSSVLSHREAENMQRIVHIENIIGVLASFTSYHKEYSPHWTDQILLKVFFFQVLN